MATNPFIASALSNAKKALSKSNAWEKTVPGAAEQARRLNPPPTSVSKKPALPSAPKPSFIDTLSEEGNSIAKGLEYNRENINQYLKAQKAASSAPKASSTASVPKMHKGGKVPKTQTYLLKKGETVRTPEQEKTLQNKLKKASPRAILSGRSREDDEPSSLPITAAPIAYFVRHGDTDLNDKDVFRADLDPPLNEEGKKQAEELVHFFRDVNPIALYHSSRLRVKQTIHPIAESKGMTPIVTRNLDSLDTGNMAGKPKNKKNKEIMLWYVKHPDAKIPGGGKVREFQQAADNEFDRLFREGQKEKGRPVIAGVHGSIIKELGRYLHGDSHAAHVEPGGVVGVYRLPSGAYVAKPLLKENTPNGELPEGS